MGLACKCEVSAEAWINMTICCPLPEVSLWSVSEGFLTDSLFWGSLCVSRSGPGETLDSVWERVTTDRPPVWLTGNREDEDEDEGCWLLLWMVKNRNKRRFKQPLSKNGY